MRYELVLPRTRGLPDDTSRPSASLALDPGAHAQHFDLDPGGRVDRGVAVAVV